MGAATAFLRFKVRYGLSPRAFRLTRPPDAVRDPQAFRWVFEILSATQVV